MMRILDYTIPTDCQYQTIENFLIKKGYSHSILVHLKKTPKSVLLNGKWEYLRTPIKAGDNLRITLVESESSTNILPIPMPIDIYYEDKDILVINKPASMPIHPSKRHPTDTLANAVCAYFHAQEIPFTFRCVNRLDSDTTGLVIIAKHLLSSVILNQAICERSVHREYLALVYGCPPEKGTISAPISRENDSSVIRTVNYEHGECAITHYRRILFQDGISLLSLYLETGRTHQIRVHMKHIGHSLIGDTLYCSDYMHYSNLSSLNPITRQALHSYRLQFKHPITGIPMDFTAPLPSDMAELISQAPPVDMQPYL